MTVSLDFGAFDRLTTELRRAGLGVDADQLDEAVHRTAYTTSNEMIGEIGLAVRAAVRSAERIASSELVAAIQAAQIEVQKAWPDFPFA